MLRLGVHVSIAGKIYYSIDRAKKLGCNTMQIFARNPRQIRRSSLKDDDIKLFRKYIKTAGIKPLIIHAPYTLNLASVKNFLYHISIKEFTEDVKDAYKLGAEYIVIHPGSYKGKDVAGLKRIARALGIVLDNTRGLGVNILLENTAGDGSMLGYTLSQLKFILQKLKFNKRIGLCLDTAHAWCAGYEINTEKGLSSFVNEIEHEIGIERIRVIHLNDTLDRLSSCKDRHFHIGKGKIGKKGFRLIVNHKAFRRLPFILETPKKSIDDDKNNLKVVRKLYKNAVR